MSELQIKTKLITESRFDKNKIDGLPRIGQWAIESIRKNIIDKKIMATGRTQRSVQYRLMGEKALQIYAESGNRAPIQTLQYGREPGKMPPVAPIKEWIVAKGLSYSPIACKRKESKNWKAKYTPDERGLNSLAWAIAMKIKRSGTGRYVNNDIEVYSPVLSEVVELFKTYIVSETEKAVVTALMK
jgi:hypothetical protein